MKWIILLLLFIPLPDFAQALPDRPNEYDGSGLRQGSWIHFYNSNWEEQPEKDEASFYRLVDYRDSKPVGRVVDYFINGKIQMVIDSIINEDKGLFHGCLSQYSERGKITWVECYVGGVMDSVETIGRFKIQIDLLERENPLHLDLSYLFNDLGYLLREQGRFQESLPYYLTSKNIRGEVLGLDNLLYANSCNKLAYIYLNLKEYAQAEPLYREALSIQEMKEGKTYQGYISSRDNLVRLYMRTDRAGEALPLLEEARALRLESYGPDDEEFLRRCRLLAQAHAVLENWDEARNFLAESKGLPVDQLPPDWRLELVSKD